MIMVLLLEKGKSGSALQPNDPEAAAEAECLCSRMRKEKQYGIEDRSK